MHYLNKPARVIIILALIGVFYNNMHANTQPRVLLAYDSANKYSENDMTGFSAALKEAGISFDSINLKTENITLKTLQCYATLVLSELKLSNAEIDAVNRYVKSGGGLIACGQATVGLENILGIKSYSKISSKNRMEIRFSVKHPVSYGCFWDGPCMENPPMPRDEIPTISQFIYPEPIWPRYSAKNNTGVVIARWFLKDETWSTSSGEPGIVVNRAGMGKTVYCGALPGLYNEPQWKQLKNWKRFIINAIEWTSLDNYLVELGYWPNAYKASFVWSGDTETPEMKKAVPLILDIFQSLRLRHFGTFYIVAKKGGDPGTEGTMEHADIVRLIIKSGSEVAGHGDVHLGFDKGTLTEQTKRLKDMIKINDEIIRPFGESCKGFRAPHVDFSDITRQASREAGLLYTSSDLDVWSESLFPFFDQVWEAPPTMPMDWTLFEYTPVSDKQAMAIYKDKFDYVYANRGMFNWLCHPWVIYKHPEVLKNVLQFVIRKGDVWMIRQDKLIDWWIKRKKLVLSKAVNKNDSVIVGVRNDGERTVENASIWLRLKKKQTAAGFEILSNKNRISPIIRKHNNQLFIVAVIPGIDPGEQTSIIFKNSTTQNIYN